MLKKVGIVGGGPAGLYMAYLLKVQGLAEEVVIQEQNPHKATYGFGVSLAGSSLAHFREMDEHSHTVLKEHMYTLQKQIIDLPDERICVRANRNAGAIGRADLLIVLEELCQEVGITVQHGKAFDSLSSLDDCDLIVGADGSNSAVRSELAAEFGTSTQYLGNRFSWYGTECPFEGSTLSFVGGGDKGNWCGHHYRYSETMSTFVPECDSYTWEAAGLNKMDDSQRRAFIEDLFADELQGYPLIENNSVWRRFRVTRNERWFFGNVVLVGDALFAAHYSIGSGTRLAMEDIIALIEALRESPDSLDSALALFQVKREPARARFENSCETSWVWYEEMGDKLATLPPYEFAYDYMTRTGRLNDDSLRAISPEFMDKLDLSREA